MLNRDNTNTVNTGSINIIRRILEGNLYLILLCLAFYLIGIPIGYILFEESEEIVMPVMEKSKELVDLKMKFQTTINIFLNNLEASLMLFLSGTLIIIPFLILLINGFILGFAIRMFMLRHNDIILFFSVLLPHSIFELPAILISAALGIRIGTTYLRPKGNIVISVSEAIKEGCFIYLILVIPLLFIAAFVESYISTMLI